MAQKKLKKHLIGILLFAYIPKYKTTKGFVEKQNGVTNTLILNMNGDQNIGRDYMIQVTTKLKKWSYEKEYRLIWSTGIVGVENINKRKLKYNFEDLDGIIFGLNTEDEHIVQIFHIIKDKCINTGRKEFYFFQACYSNVNRKIDLAKVPFQI